MPQLPREEPFDLHSSQLQLEKSAVQVRLLKGPIYRARHKQLWFCLERDQFQIREYFQEIGLSLHLDDVEGYAFLKQIDFEQEDNNQSVEEQDSTKQEQENIQIPRLISRRSLSFGHTLILVLLRKRLAEHDSEDSSPRLMVSRSEIHQWLHPFFAAVSNELKQSRDFDSLIKKMIEMGILSNIVNTKDEFEVQRIINSMLNADQIVSLLDKLKEYKIKEDS